MSFSTRAMRRVREQAPALPTVLLLDTIPAMRWDGSLPPCADYTGPDVAILRRDPGYVGRSAAHGHHTYTWTVDDPADIQLCQRLGVRYLATNSPATTRAVLDVDPGGNVRPDPPSP
jgi:glycerophosphoryl diester phosphodiesterase